MVRLVWDEYNERKKNHDSSMAGSRVGRYKYSSVARFYYWLLVRDAVHSHAMFFVVCWWCGEHTEIGRITNVATLSMKSRSAVNQTQQSSDGCDDTLFLGVLGCACFIKTIFGGIMFCAVKSSVLWTCGVPNPSMTRRSFSCVDEA